MSRMLQSFLLSIIAVLLVGCSGMIRMYNLHDQPVGRELTREQVEKAIRIGAAASGWQIQEAGSDLIIANYRIRAHTVIVDIRYTDRYYSIDYRNSNQMKVHCTEQDKTERRPVTVTGGNTCSGGAQPAYIHGNYQGWIDSLNQAIRGAISSV